MKLELDEDQVATVEEARALASGYVMQLVLGAGIETSAAYQAAALTVVNAGARAFLGGVRVRIGEDPTLNAGWAKGQRLSEAIARFGGTVVKETDDAIPTLVLGQPSDARVGSGVVLYPTWAGWSGGMVEDPSQKLAEQAEYPLSGVLAGALGVSELFQHIRGNQEAARRSVGLSLWRPDLDWRDPESVGPPISFLPSAAWILGLGHLGQAYCWCLGWLPFAKVEEVLIYLMDFDVIEEANASTGLLVDGGCIGETKVRAVSRCLESLGMRTRISERAFDSHTRRTAGEPSLALAGFDDPLPRRELEGANFELIVDAGLGASASHYNEIQLHAFPSGLRARDAFQSHAPQRTPHTDQAAYRDLVNRLAAAGQTIGEAECGVLEIAGRTAGAAFVGAVAGTLVLGEALRTLCRGPRYQVIDVSLRSPEHRIAVENEASGPFVNPGYTRAVSSGR